MDDLFAINRELSGKPTLDDSSPRRGSQRKRNRKEPRTKAGFQAKPKTSRASERASHLAQRWYDLGEAEGFSFPYDVNYLALALQRKVEGDKEMRPLLLAGKHDQVERWVHKMIGIWWNAVDEDGHGGYLTNEINQRNAKDYFLDTDWDDLREYALSNLRMAYLREHGRRVSPPVYDNQQKHRERLESLRKEAVVEQHLRTLEEHPELNERPEVDDDGRERLRSFVEKRRNRG